MKAIVYERYGSPDVLELKEVEKPFLFLLRKHEWILDFGHVARLVDFFKYPSADFVPDAFYTVLCTRGIFMVHLHFYRVSSEVITFPFEYPQARR